MPKYDKAHLSFEDQLALLTKRGLVVGDPTAALQSLKTIGYYRISAYTHSFRIPLRPSRFGHDERHNQFTPGATFDQVMGLWEFDRQLRLLLLDGLERFEIALRTAIAYTLGARSAFGHLEPEHLDAGFVAQPPTTEVERLSKHDKWLVGYYERQQRAEREAFVSWYAHKYDSKLPIWVAIEILEFGQTSFLYQGLQLGDRNKVSAAFGISSSKQFTGWIASFNDMRNVSAHHSRLWNRTLVKQASRPKPGIVRDLDHLQQLDKVSAGKIYPSLAILAWLLTTTIPSFDWHSRLLDLLHGFPDNPVVSLANAGFPTDWEKLALWNRPRINTATSRM